MSYILDALKKSERERNQGQIPDLKSVHVEQVRRREKNNLALMILIVVLAANTAAGLYWYWSAQDSDSQSTSLEYEAMNGDAALVGTQPVVRLVKTDELPRSQHSAAPNSIVQKPSAQKNCYLLWRQVSLTPVQ